MTITLKDISESARRKIEARAQRDGKSLGEAVLSLVEDAPVVPERTVKADESELFGDVVHHDLDWFIKSGPLEPGVIKALEEQRIVVPDDQP